VTAGRRWPAVLAAVSLLTLGGVGLWTRGTSRQLAAEARLDAIASLAGQHGVPVEALLALAVAEGYRPAPRSDATLAAALASALAAAGGSLPAAVRVLGQGEVEARMTLDLVERHGARWRRLRAELER
jgi:hypothetical protein